MAKAPKNLGVWPSVGDRARVKDGRLKGSVGVVKGLGHGWLYLEPSEQPKGARKGTQFVIALENLEPVV